jgi:hypothetical protein
MQEELNNIRLGTSMMTSLYGKVLVEIRENVPPVIQQDNITDIKYLGNNTQHILILVNNPEHTFLPEDQLAFLTKILGACKLNIGDVAIVNTNNHPDIKLVINYLQTSKIILFGVEANTDNIYTLSAPSINNLIGETTEAKALKSKLWGGLKQLFGI